MKQRCEARTRKNWYDRPHRCPFKAIVTVHGKGLCGTHWRQHKRIATEAAERMAAFESAPTSVDYDNDCAPD